VNRPTIVLASASPRRRELLRGLGLCVDVRPAGDVEPDHEGESPREHAAVSARVKGEAVFHDLPGTPGVRVVIAADTIVVVDGHVLGKPADATHAMEMLRRLGGRTHEVMTAAWLRRTDTGPPVRGVEVTRVRFRDYDDDWIRAYVATGEPLDKAGAYGIQERGALLSLGIEGSWSNVVGFPLERLPGWFAELGLDPRALCGQAPVSSS
jgi:septum formation protein